MHRLYRATSLLFAALLVGSCVNDTGAGEPSDTDEAATEADPTATVRDSGTSTKGHDAGSSSSGHSTPDAARAPTPTDDDDTGQTMDPPEEVDAGKGVAKADAGKADAGKADAGKADAGSGSACDSLTYASFGKGFLDKYCISCHGGTRAQSGVALDTLAGVQSSKAKTKSEVASSSMPPLFQTAPSAAERTQFGMWIDCGPK